MVLGLKNERWRWQVFSHWLAGRRNGVGPLEMLRVVCDPTLGRRAQRHIERIDDDPPYWLIRMRGIDRPLYFPQSVGMFSFETLVVEQFEHTNWHYYQIEPTRLRSDDIVLDCGAAEGLFSLQAEPVCEKVYAAEPLPMWLDALRKTFAGSQKVEILPYALSDSNRTGRLQPGILDSTITSGKEGIAVEARTIDSLFADRNRRLTYLKGDLEGAELDALRGAELTIRANSPRIAITTYHKADDAEQITGFLKRVNPRYRVVTKGIEHRAGAPVMLHAWIEK